VTGARYAKAEGRVSFYRELVDKVRTLPEFWRPVPSATCRECRINR